MQKLAVVQNLLSKLMDETNRTNMYSSVPPSSANLMSFDYKKIDEDDFSQFENFNRFSSGVVHC